MMSVPLALEMLKRKTTGKRLYTLCVARIEEWRKRETEIFFWVSQEKFKGRKDKDAFSISFWSIKIKQETFALALCFLFFRNNRDYSI